MIQISTVLLGETKILHKLSQKCIGCCFGEITDTICQNSTNGVYFTHLAVTCRILKWEHDHIEGDSYKMKGCAMEQTVATRDIAALAEKWRGKKGSLIMVLHEIQNEFGYVPREVSLQLSHLLDVPLARIYEVITFYNYFKLDPPGKYTVAVCLGTACYLKGAPEIVDEIQSLLNIKEGETTTDGLFHLDVVRCLGCCGLAPVMKINGQIYGKVKRGEVMEILSKYKNED